MSNTILLKRSGVANSVPAAGNLALGELAINYADGNLFYKDSSDQIQVIASKQFVSVVGNISGGNVLSSGIVSASGTITGGNITTAGNVNFASSGNISLGNVGNVHITGGSSGYVLSTDGAGNLTWEPTGSPTIIHNGNSNVSIPTPDGNVYVNANAATDQQWVFTTSGNLLAPGSISAAGNVTAGNISTAGSGGNITGANVISAVTFSASSNIIGGSGVADFVNTSNVSLGNVGNVHIGGGSGGYVLSTDGSGNLTWVAAGSPSIIENGYSNVTVPSANGAVYINANAATDQQWVFNTDGTTQFPELTVDLHNGGVQYGEVLQFGNASLQSIITGPTPAVDVAAQRLIIQGQRGNGTGEGGDVYIWGGDADINGGDIKIYAGDADNVIAGTGGNIHISSASGHDIGGDLALSAGNSSAGAGGDVSIRAGTGGAVSGNVYVYTNNGSNTWTFGNSGNLSAPGAISAAGNVTAGNITTSGSSGNIFGANNIVATTLSAITNVIGGSGVADFVSTGNISLGNVGNIHITGGSDGYLLTTDGAGNLTWTATASTTEIFNGFSNVSIPIANGNIYVNANAASDQQWIFATDGTLYAPGDIVANIANSMLWGYNANFAGNVTVLGTFTSSANVVSNAAGIFYGDPVTGNGALYAGKQNYTTLGSNVVMQVAGNVDSYSQINFQNVNPGTSASADYIVTADNGSDINYFLDLGLNGSNHADPTFFGDTSSKNDGYLYVTGPGTNTGTANVGNLILGATDGIIKMFVGNTAQANVIQQVTVTGVEIFGAVSATGNITAANFLTSGATGNITGANVIEAVTVSASGNVLANNVLTTGVMSAGGNVTAGNVITGGLVSAGGNIFGVNVSASGNVNAANVNAVQLSLSGNVISVINSTNDINTSANISGANIIAGTVTATGNVWVDGNVKASTSVITPELTSTGALTISTTSSGNINLQPNGTGNIVLANTYINGVAYPMQDQDAASKYYVDQATTTGFAFHAPVYATTNTDLNTATGGTVSYNQPNGAGNGIGATLTTSGSFNLIDTANIQTVGTRVLVKNEANATWNGVYTYANASAIVRATDADEYGADSTQALSINDYFFTQSGNVNAGAAFIVSAPPGTITFGTSNIEFSQFSSTQVYSANTNAGLNLTGTVFSAKVDNNTTAFDGGGNIIVKASANLTTPNIGAATGTSLSVTGLVEAGNISTGGYVSAGGNVTGDNILTGGLVSATGNVYAGNLSTGGNVTGANLLTAGLISAGGNATLGNVITGGYITATGNITVANMFTGGLISATGLVTAGNVETNGYMSSAGNVTAGNVNTGGVVKTQDFSILGNVIGNLVPSSNVTYNLGSSSRLWKDLYLSGTSIYLGDQTISSNATGVSISNSISSTNLYATNNVFTPNLVNSTGNIVITANTKSWVYNQNGNLYVPEAGQIRASSSFYGVTISDYSSLATLSLVDDATLQGNAYVRLQVIGGTQFDFSNGLANIKNANLSTTGNVIGGNILYGSGIVSGSGNVYGGTIYQSSNQVLDVTSTIDGGTY